MLTKIDFEKAKQYVAIAMLNLFGFYLVWLLREYIPAFLGAIILVIVFKKLHQKLLRKKFSEAVSASIIVLLAVFAVLLPIMGVTYMIFDKIMELTQGGLGSLLEVVNDVNRKAISFFDFKIISEENVKAMVQTVGNFATSFLGNIFYLLIQFAVMFFVMYFLLIYKKQLADIMEDYLPFNKENFNILKNELELMTLSNVIVLPVLGIIQAIAAMFSYWLFEFPEPIFWGIITGIFSFLPMIGTALVWIPVGVFQMVFGEVWQGAAILIYGAFVISNIDNVVRLMLQRIFADVHPIITVFGVILGLELFGMPGLIFGPLMISWFVLLIRIYRKSYKGIALADDEDFN